MLLPIISISILSGVLVKLNCATVPTTEAEVLHYLEAIGRDVASHQAEWPLVYVINNVDKPWKLEHLGSWIELVGIVCENVLHGQSLSSANIMTGCSLFDGIAAHFLTSLHSEVIDSGKDPSQAIAYYGQSGRYVTFDQAKGFFPSVCKKIMPPKGVASGNPQNVIMPHFHGSLRRALSGCRLLIDISVEYLVESQARGMNNYTMSIVSKKYSGVTIQLDQVRNMFPWICDVTAVRRVKRELISMACGFFTDSAKNILEVTNDAVQRRQTSPAHQSMQIQLSTSPISIPQAKEFIADECKKGKYQLACNFLLQERLDILLFGP